MNDRFLKACRREEVDITPVWFMRQAGRYLPEYRKIREKNDIMTICKTPELSTQVTLLPLQEFDVDAAILFADIMLPLEAIGVDLEFVENVGPVIQKPVQGMRDVDTLRMIEPGEDLPFVLDAIRMIRRELEGKLPLIGFSGAPFTLASYLIEGGPSRVFIKTKSMMYREPHLWHSLMEKLTEIVRRYMKSQISAGVQALQLFDSWVGCLSPEDYREYVLPYSRSILQGLREMEIPIIHFGTGTATLLKLMKEAGGDVVGVDWRIPLDDAWERIGYDVGIQGNLDPALLLGPVEGVKNRVLDILSRANSHPGHIFNLGHGILPQTPVENVRRLVEMVHEYSYQNKK